MPAMTMPFRLEGPGAGAATGAPGDLIRATLMVTDEESWLAEHREDRLGAVSRQTTGRAAPPWTCSRPGDPVPDETLVDQDGKAFRISSLRGVRGPRHVRLHPLPAPGVLSRGWTPTSPPSRRRSGDGRLLAARSACCPSRSTPTSTRRRSCKAHAASVGADPAIWTFATAPRDRVEAWGGRLGLSVIRDAKDRRPTSPTTSGRR